MVTLLGECRCDAGALCVAAPGRPTGNGLVLRVDRDELAVGRADVDPTVVDDRLAAYRRADLVRGLAFARLRIETHDVTVERAEQDRIAGGERRGAEEAALLRGVAGELVRPHRLAGLRIGRDHFIAHRVDALV